MPNPAPNQSKLIYTAAPDKPGETELVPARIRLEDKEWLDAQEEGRSYHLRQAIAGYIAEIENLQKVAQALGMQPSEAIAYCIRQTARKAPF